MIILCSCGREGEHCPSANCKGSINRHPMKQRSVRMTERLGIEARFYSCRSCGTEYGYVNGVLYESECYAPKKIILSTKLPDAIDEVKAINEAILLLQSKGITVTMNGIPMAVADSNEVEESKTPNESEPELIIQRLSDKPKDELPEGWFYDEQGRKSSGLKIDDLFKPKEPPNDPDKDPRI